MLLQKNRQNRYWKALRQKCIGAFFNNNDGRFTIEPKQIVHSKKDILTWTADDFHDTISKLYLASIKDDKLLKQTKLEPFDAIILKGNVRYLRPTLYDLLAHRALDYFKSDENDITRPAYAFEIKDEKAFAAGEFIHQKFENKDSTSLHYKALLIFQDCCISRK